MIETFESYRQAVGDRDGDTAADLVGPEGLDHYDTLSDVAGSAGPEEFAELPAMDRFVAALFRIAAGPEQAAEMDGHAAYSFGVQEGLVDDSSVAGTEIDTVAVHGDRATAALLVHGQPAPYEFTFQLLDGMWKFDIMPVLRMARASFPQLAEQQGLTEEEFIFRALEAYAGEPVDESLFERP
ncbi:hypothetical protein [Saccharomonospora saliphila]|uniref:hypothetical protein n=1 Tax=Saccharomonospora saliphila TaxID=369829 RepID=UPI00048ADB78|nr:hypothetical protein [Saccharomonospora saliphila]